MLDRCLDSYRLVRLLGEGGFGAVYESVHVRIGQRAAIKVLHPEIAKNADMATRFLNEARAASIVRHPSIIQIFGVGRLEDGTSYILMEYLEGESLRQRLQRLHSLPASDALRIARQVASALAAAHERGVIHRDLKPDNLMIVADTEATAGERIKVVDFGIAKLSEGLDQMTAQMIHTRTGVPLGTPAYMSPEQCRGAGEVGGSTDVYSLGVILYEMLSGRRPFVAEGQGAILAMQIYEQPRPLERVNPGIDPALAALVNRMLLKQPSARPTMAEIEDVLEQAGAPGGPVRVASGPVAALRRVLRRNGAWVAAGVAAPVGLGLALYSARPQPPSRPVVETTSAPGGGTAAMERQPE